MFLGLQHSLCVNQLPSKSFFNTYSGLSLATPASYLDFSALAILPQCESPAVGIKHKCIFSWYQKWDKNNKQFSLHFPCFIMLLLLTVVRDTLILCRTFIPVLYAFSLEQINLFISNSYWISSYFPQKRTPGRKEWD